MRKNIKNYTSDMPVNRCITNIQNLLVAKGAEKIMIDYKDGEPIGITFLIKSKKGLIPVMLPARTENVIQVMYGTQTISESQLTQSKRTAWKNIFDWIDAQIAMIETEMVTFEEVFLPYIVMGNKTVFEHFEDNTLHLPEGQQ